MTIVYIGLGANLGDPVAQLHQAVSMLGKAPLVKVTAVSSLYRSAPLGIAGQPDYINTVVRVETTLSAFELLRAMQEIENKCGRVRSSERWAPRTLDLDLLLYGDEIIDHQDLVLPHPEMTNRNFVLQPLYDISGDIEIPGKGHLADLLAKVGDAGLQRLEEPEMQFS